MESGMTYPPALIATGPLKGVTSHPCRIVKCHFGFKRVYYRGILKNDLKLKMLFALANLWMARRRMPELA